ncbi:hypothetical protein [Bartonella grahamii]|uniref:hypothetical protein n=1 Tax=Bartonella grahamii TaxID=33045 RepID=UPI002E7AD7D1|nr:hypothetical protein [Bartonella grahamii]
MKKKPPIHLEQLQRASNTVEDEDMSSVSSQPFFRVTADCRSRVTTHYAVTELEIESLRDCAVYAHHFDTVIGILLGALVSLTLGLIWDESHWEKKAIVILIISVFLVWLCYLKRKARLRSDRIWQYIKQASEDMSEKK